MNRPMKCIKHLLCVYIATAAINGLAANSADDTKAIQGNWKPIKADLAGQPMPDSVIKTISLKLENGKYEVFVGEHPDRGTYTMDPTAKSKAMTVTGTEGPNKGKTFPAIYSLDGDTLQIC